MEIPKYIQKIINKQ